jgi:hypothetical protein
MKPPKKRPTIEDAWKTLLRLDRDARWFTDEALHRMTKISRRACYNYISQWLLDGLVEAKPSVKGWRRQVRRVVAERPIETDSPEAEMAVATVSDKPEGDATNPYVTAVAEYGEQFIAILNELRDTAVDSRIRFAAAAALAEFGCLAPGSAKASPVVDEKLEAKTAALAWLRDTLPSEHNDEVVRLTAEVLAQFGQTELDKVLANSICRGENHEQSQ